LYYPHHKTTAYWRESMLAGGKYPTPPDEETIEQNSDKFEPDRRMPVFLKGKGGQKKRRKSKKEISMAKVAAKARSK
jgi:hypothetical protein